jgi:hypothetical protein
VIAPLVASLKSGVGSGGDLPVCTKVVRAAIAEGAL